MNTKPTSQEAEPRTSRLGFFKKLFAVIGGADPRILEKAPATAFRFVEISVVLIGTAVVAGLSMAFALTSGVHVPLAVAIPVAVVWALIILNLDRFLTSQMKSTRNAAKLLVGALPRVGLALIIGVIVATPMTIRIFQTEVDAEVARMNRAASAALIGQLEGGELVQARDKQKNNVDALREQANGLTADVSGDSRVIAVQAKMERAKEDWELKEKEASQAELLFQCDRYGDEEARAKLTDPSKCSPKSGPNGLAAQYERDAANLRVEATTLSQTYTAARDELSSVQATVATESTDTVNQRKQEAEKALPAALDEFDRLERLVAEEANAARAKVDGADGLLAQIEALSNLSKSPAMGSAHTAVFLLFLVIELLPVIVKIFSSYGDPSLYEIVQDNDQRFLAKQARIERERKVEQLQGEAQRDLAIENDMLEREKELGVEANEYVQTQMRDVVTQSLQQWGAQLTQQGVDPNAATAWPSTAPVERARPMAPAMPGGLSQSGNGWRPANGARQDLAHTPPARRFNPAQGHSGTRSANLFQELGSNEQAPNTTAWAQQQPHLQETPNKADFDAVYRLDDMDGDTIIDTVHAPEPSTFREPTIIPAQTSQRSGIIKSGFVAMDEANLR